ncbi:MAG: hypothetical protein AAF744_06895 [Pseudomonadota bacterium]
MRFVIQSVTSGDRTTYVHEKMTAMQTVFAGTDIDEVVTADLAPPAPVPLVPEADQPTPTAEQEAKLRSLKACALADVHDRAPLTQGEKLVSDTFSYLAEDFGQMPAGTAALLRRTSLAELVYFFEDVTIQGSDLHVGEVPSTTWGQPGAADVPQTVPPIVIDIAKMLAEKVGTAIFESYFPDNKVPAYFEEVFDRIRGIIHNENLAQTIRELMGKYTGVMRFVNNEYEAEKAEHGVSKELLARLQRQSDDMYLLVAELMVDEQTAMMGLSAFLAGASAHLAMLQEIAIQRKAAGIAHDASASEKTFDEYADHLVATFDKINKARRKMVKVEDDYKCHVHHGTQSCNYWFYRFDTLNKSEGEHHSYWGEKAGDKRAEAKRKAEADVKAYKNKLTDDLTKLFDYPVQVANLWRSSAM